MISCTEFIPAYSELFTYLEKNYGRAEIDRYWEYHFSPDANGLPLANMVKKEGIRGCYTYWSGTLNEEAADFTMYLNEKNGWFKLDMHHCPSKGRLLELKEELGFIPYHDYCLHCDHYRESVAQAGLEYMYDFSHTNNASCSIIIYDPFKFNGKLIVDDDTVVMSRKASDNEYFHLDFHFSMNKGIHYLGEKYGIEVVKDYLTTYTNNVYKKEIECVKKFGIKAIEDKILDTYKKEKAEDAIKTEITENSLIVNVEYCPAVKHLISTGRVVSVWYKYTTEFVMSALAEATNFDFNMTYYDEKTGKAQYKFSKA